MFNSLSTAPTYLEGAKRKLVKLIFREVSCLVDDQGIKKMKGKKELMTYEELAINILS